MVCVNYYVSFLNYSVIVHYPFWYYLDMNTLDCQNDCDLEQKKCYRKKKQFKYEMELPGENPNGSAMYCTCAISVFKLATRRL